MNRKALILEMHFKALQADEHELDEWMQARVAEVRGGGDRDAVSDDEMKVWLLGRFDHVTDWGGPIGVLEDGRNRAWPGPSGGSGVQ